MRNLIKKNPKYSKRINYDALKDLFTDADSGSPVPMIKLPPTPTPGPQLQDEYVEDNAAFITDDKSDGEGVGMAVVVEESGGGVGASARIVTDVGDGEADDDDMYAEETDKGEEYVEWEGYEQEV